MPRALHVRAGRGMRRYALPMLLTLLLGACQRQAAVPDRVDGLYFLDRGFASMGMAPKLLLLEGGLFELLEDDELELRGTFELREGLLRLKPAGLGPGAELETTYAVVEGRLLLGVLRRVGGSRQVWTSAALPAELLDDRELARIQPGAFRIDWDMREGRWRFTSGARQVVLSGVSRFELPAQGGQAFLPVFRRPAQRGGGDDPASMLTRQPHDLQPSEYGVMRFGVEADPEMPLGWEGELVRLRPGDAGSGWRPDDLLRALSNPAQYPPYVRRGEVVVTPWTVDLGPVGLLPVRAEPSALAGSYVSGGEALTVFAQPPPRDPGEPPYDVGLRKPGEEQRCVYRPDARGLVTWTLGMEHLPMSHGDKPFRVFCFALADGRVVRYISSGGCNASQPERLDVFQRHASPGAPTDGG